MLFAGILLLGLLNIAGSGKTTVSAAQATDNAQQTFSTPEQAGQALRAAAGDDDEGVLAQVLGPDSKAILFSGDAAEDKAALAAFAAKYDRMNRWVTMTDGTPRPLHRRRQLPVPDSAGAERELAVVLQHDRGQG